MSGYALAPQGTDNATCTSSNGRTVTTENHPNGFRVHTDADEILTCTVYDRAPAAPPPPPTASVIVRKFWDINGVRKRDGDQNADFVAEMTLDPRPGDSQPVWGEEFPGYHEGETVTVDEEHTRVPDGCSAVATSGGGLGTHTLHGGRNTFTVVNTVTCRAHLTLVKRISNPFPGLKLVPLTSWTLMARRFAGSAPVISGTTPASGTILSGVPYVLSESSVPGYQQQVDPGADLVQGATGSWHCVQVVDGVADSEVFEGGNGAVIAAPGEHIRCTATNIPVSVPVTG